VHDYKMHTVLINN